jgi:hypothetical protein
MTAAAVFTLAAKQARKAHPRLTFLPVSKARADKLYIFRDDNVRILYIFESPYFFFGALWRMISGTETDV